MPTLQQTMKYMTSKNSGKLWKDTQYSRQNIEKSMSKSNMNRRLDKYIVEKLIHEVNMKMKSNGHGSMTLDEVMEAKLIIAADDVGML